MTDAEQDNLVLSLPEDNESDLARHIVIPVEVPEIQVVHTAELRLSTTDSNMSTHAAVGHMIPAELILHHTRRWCSHQTETQDSSGGGGQLEFAYELHVNQDQWLIGGRRRGHFTAAEGETKKFAIMLLPQKAGHLLLPSIEIKTFIVGASSASVGANTSTTMAAAGPAAPSTASGNPSSVTSPASATTTSVPSAPWTQQQRRQVPNEVDYKNHAETILVLPDLRKTTVSLESGNPGLIESESRIAV